MSQKKKIKVCVTKNLSECKSSNLVMYVFKIVVMKKFHFTIFLSTLG